VAENVQILWRPDQPGSTGEPQIKAEEDPYLENI
jgi:hypothetical protein